MKNEFRLSENRLQQNILICITIQSKFDFHEFWVRIHKSYDCGRLKAFCGVDSEDEPVVNMPMEYFMIIGKKSMNEM